MKKITTTMLIAVSAMLLAACSSSDELQQQTAQPENGGWSEYVTITAGTPGDAGTTTGGSRRVAVNTDNPQKSLWEEGDKLTIWTGETCSTENMSQNGFTLTSGVGEGTAKFSGRIVSPTMPTNATKLIAIIDNENDAIDADEGDIVYVDLSTQRYCTAESALDHELFYATSTNGARNFTFTHKLALIKWTIKVNGASAGDKCDITLGDKLYGDVLASYYYFDPNTGKEKYGYDENDITLKDVTLTSANSTELYVVMAPASYTGITATLTMTSGEKAGQIAFGYLGDGNSISFAENKYYTAGINEFTPNEYVDLGLPSGTKWALHNLGATSPEEYGDYYAWGETEPYYSSLSPLVWKPGKEEGYSPESYFDNTYTKYSVISYTTLEDDDDAATVNWGSEWCIPTKVQMQELLDETDKEWTTINGVSGYKFMNKTNHSQYIFLPAAGYYSDTILHDSGTNLSYWTDEAEFEYDNAHYLYKDSYGISMSDDCRFFGFSVRPVRAN